MSNRCYNILLCGASLTAGAIIYVLFRENTYIAIFFDRWSVLRLIQAWVGGRTWGGFQYYLPDLLWGFSLSCGMVAIWGPDCSPMWCSTGVFFGCIWELMQRFCIVSGTADWTDILMYLIGSGLCFIINKRRIVK